MEIFAGAHAIVVSFRPRMEQALQMQLDKELALEAALLMEVVMPQLMAKVPVQVQLMQMEEMLQPMVKEQGLVLHK